MNVRSNWREINVPYFLGIKRRGFPRYRIRVRGKVLVAKFGRSIRHMEGDENAGTFCSVKEEAQPKRSVILKKIFTGNRFNLPSPLPPSRFWNHPLPIPAASQTMCLCFSGRCNIAKYDRRDSHRETANYSGPDSAFFRIMTSGMRG